MAGPDPVAELYQVDPDEFVAARNRLAKELKAEGRKSEAAEVATRRRPPPSAWALNQVARERPELVDAVLDAGSALRGAMEDAMGGDASGVRQAQAAERRTVDAAVTAATKVLTDAGKAATDALKLRIAAILRAAVVDGEVADLVRRGVLDADRDAPGFGLDGFSVAAAPAAARRATRPTPKRPPPPAGKVPDADTDPAAEAKAEEAERRRIAAEADEAEDRARRLEREATEAERRAAQLAEASEAAAAEAEKAAERASRLGSDAAAAAGRARDARAAAEAADTAARDARRRAQGG